MAAPLIVERSTESKQAPPLSGYCTTCHSIMGCDSSLWMLIRLDSLQPRPGIGGDTKTRRGVTMTLPTISTPLLNQAPSPIRSGPQFQFPGSGS